MNQRQAQKIITELFTQPFEHKRYRRFLHDFLNDFEPKDKHYTGNYIPDAFKEHINQYWRIGKYIDPNNDELDLLVVEVKTLSKLDRARTTLRNFAVNRLKQFEKEASLIAFYSKEDGGEDWRFSFVQLEYDFYQDDKGKVKLKQELTPAKRYSYLVGVHENSHTASKQLLPILLKDTDNPTIEQIKEAFSVEKVSNEFFEQYKELFLNLAEHLKQQPFFQSADKEESLQKVNRFAKKLLGQIVFLYFLQKKGWLGVPKDKKWGKGSKRFMRERFEQIQQEKGNYFQDFLQYLFYEALAQKREDENPDYYQRFNCKIPFLNGGLFEADYDWKNESIDLPNELFHNDKKNKIGDRGTGILDVFDRYNFTIKEDEPLEKEVAIDPEMLGKVFENMLEITERKSKGAFYTPREIVHYMCQESLIHYLDNTLNDYSSYNEEIGSPQSTFLDNNSRKGQLKFLKRQKIIRVPREDLEILVHRGIFTLDNEREVRKKGRETKTYSSQLPKSLQKHAQDIDQALANIKICDPAIGSGAFPVGLLHEIVHARLVLAPYSNNQSSTYSLKRHAIQESIYGADIDPSAIDIARLRLWLSLIVDEENYDSIEPLPNLDYKIVQGNSLIGLNADLFNIQLLNQLEEKKKEFFHSTDSHSKKQLQQEIEKLFDQLTQGQRIFDFKIYFSEVWHQKDGFDIVIGNPPYVQIQKFSGQQIQKEWEKQKYQTFTKTGDIYCLFYEKGYQILRPNGLLAFITSNKWMRASYGKKLRKFLLNSTQIEQLLDFGDSPIFSQATTYTNILLFSKIDAPTRQPQVWDLSSAYQITTALKQLLLRKQQGVPLFNSNGFIILNSDLAKIKKQIEKVGTPLKEWDISIYYGIKTGLNEAFIIDGKKKDELIAADPKSAEIIKPVLRGRDIKRYQIHFADLWLINTHNGYGDVPPIVVDDYPAIKKHLEPYWKKLKKRQDKGITPYNLRNCAYIEEFEKEKVVWGEIVFNSAFYYDNSGIYPEATTFIMTGKHIKHLIAMLNSELLTFAFRFFYAGGDLRGNTFRYKKAFLMNLPIIELKEQKINFLNKLVDYVQFLKKHEEHLQSAFFEQVIDVLVYELYFPEEIKAAGKGIFSHLGDLKPLSDNMTEEEKFAVIREEFDRLYDPNHPVRNAVATIDNVEVVHIIREALKR